MDIQAPQSAGSGRFGRPERYSNGDRAAGPGRRPWERNTERSADRSPQPHERAPRSDSSGHVHFSVNWGFHRGANPRRLMALICRRGDITSRMVGHIKPGPTSTIFEIREQVAADFEQRAQRPDPRDPKLAIHRVSDALRTVRS
jgi:ATP-dependent RNA helicase DeaD